MANFWSGILFRIAKHWIAGETCDEALARAEQSNGHNVRGIINLLGEDATIREETEDATHEYVKILNEIHSRNIRSCISIKPTQLGLAIDKTLCKSHLESIVGTAKSFGSFVWIDMESSGHTYDTINLYLGLLRKFDNVGLAIQAYLRRSEDDVNRIVDNGGTIRLCKGSYNERPDIVYKRRKEIDKSYSKLMRIIFERSRGFAIATHDEKLIEEACKLGSIHHADFEFEMLMGIRDKKKIQLVDRGYRVSEYIPFGKRWWAYSVRRIREHKSNIFLLARSLVSG